MKLSFDKLKEKFKQFDFANARDVAKEFVLEHYKVAGSVAVVAAMCVVCTVSLVERANNKDTSVGVMMTLSDVAQEKEAFAGNTFDVACISYDDMLTVSYDTDKLAQLEKTEKQIDEILAAKAQNKSRKDQAALEALTAKHVGPEIDPNPVAPVINVNAPSVAPTYADANGNYTYLGDFVLTGYCACPICCGAYSNMENPTTASGTTATAGRTIAAPAGYAFGTQLIINGQVYTVEDRGSAITGNRIDIFFSSHQEALNFGRRTASVFAAQ